MRHKISDVQIERVEPKDGLIGFANFTLDGKIRFQSVAIFTRIGGGIRLSWPEKQRGIKKIKTAAPISTESFLDIEAQILEALNKAESNNANPVHPRS